MVHDNAVRCVMLPYTKSTSPLITLGITYQISYQISHQPDNMSNSDKNDTHLPVSPVVDAFLNKVKSTPVSETTKNKVTDNPARLIFALDATASREPTWDQACQIQSQMFVETTALGSLEVQLCYYRGFNEFSASEWMTQPDALLRSMSRVYCVGGHTQIAKLLQHAIEESRRQKLHAVVFVGDCMEENVDHLCQLAGQLAILGVPIFIFHEGGDVIASAAFRQLASITHGAYCPFDSGSAQQLRDLLSAVAVYAVGGRDALEDFQRRKGTVLLPFSHKENT